MRVDREAYIHGAMLGEGLLGHETQFVPVKLS